MRSVVKEGALYAIAPSSSQKMPLGREDGARQRHGVAPRFRCRRRPGARPARRRSHPARDPLGRQHRLDQLAGHGVRMRRVGADFGRPCARQVVAAEQAVQERQGRRVVAVDVVVAAVVPVVEGRRGHEPLQRAEAPAQVGVDEEAPHGAEHQQQRRRGAAGGVWRGQAEQVERHQAEQAGDDHVDRMRAGIGQEVHALGAVVQRVEAPQPRDFMAEPVAPVEAGLGDDEGEQHAQRPRQLADGPDQGGRHHGLGGGGQQRHRRGEQDDRHQAADEVVREVVAQRAAVLRTMAVAEPALERDEHGRQQRQPDAQAQGGDGEFLERNGHDAFRSGTANGSPSLPVG